MYLFGFPEGLSGGSKETSYLTNYNTSHGTSRTTSYNTGWYTSRTTSRTTSRGTSHNTTASTSWSSVGNTGWQTSKTTSGTTSSTRRGMVLNVDTSVVGTDCGYMFNISDDPDNRQYGPKLFATIGFYYKYSFGGGSNSIFKTATDGRLFLDVTGLSSGISSYRMLHASSYLKFLNVWLDGVPRGWNDNYGANPPTYSECYNASKIEVEFNMNFNGTGLEQVKVEMGTRRESNIYVFPHKQWDNFFPNTTISYYDPTASQYRCINGPQTLTGGWGVSNVPFGTKYTSFSTAGPMTYKSTTFTPSKNTTYSTDYSTSFGTSYGTSFHTSRGTSKGTAFTTTYGTSNTTDHITYG